ncbi:MAG: hypothetical protein BGO21_07255 [Dyadobacter sp. 50-39]|uniref:efflux RND transporter permease subunit n=1 Tax=Dyadobacter sp. 50-39 TaxID=1895756 RepID=UPI00095B9036|nr:efflux RND transporter permease subunit [Dyadobacter sp. 50-39]OJV17170.1 MAG: hypothetical protein BGO21_07255 [Dyadobacter sp. 50-39]
MIKRAILSPFSTILLFIFLASAGLLVSPFLNVSNGAGKQAQDAIYIDFTWENASPSAVETNVTAKLEGIISTIRGIKNVFSTSTVGRGSLVIEIDSRRKYQEIRYEITSVVRQYYSKLPKGVSHPVVSNRPTSSASSKPIASFAIASSTVENVYEVINSQLTPEFSAIEQIYKIEIHNKPEVNWYLELDPALLLRLGISVDDALAQIRPYLSNSDLGTIQVKMGGDSPRSGTIQLRIINVLDFRRVWELLPIKSSGGGVTRLGDLAELNFRRSVDQSIFRVNGRDALVVSIFALDQSNYFFLGKYIKQAVGRFRSKLPKGFVFHVLTDEGGELVKKLEGFLFQVACSLLIVTVFLFFSTRNVAYALALVYATLCNVLISLLVFFFLGLQIDIYSITWLSVAVCLTFDNAIVMIEHCRSSRRYPVLLTMIGSAMVIVGTVSITLLTTREIAEWFQNFAWITIVWVFVSVIVAALLVPALVSTTVNGTQRVRIPIQRYKRIVRWNSIYIRFITRLMSHRKKLCAVLILIFGMPFFLLPRSLEGDNIVSKSYNGTFGSEPYVSHIRPWLDVLCGGLLQLFSKGYTPKSWNSETSSPSIYIQASMPKGTTIGQIARVLRVVENAVEGAEGVERYTVTANSGNQAIIHVLFKSFDRSNQLAINLKRRVERAVLKVGLAEFNIYGVDRGFSNVLDAASMNRSISLYGYDYLTLTAFADQVKRRLLTYSKITRASISDQEYWSSKGIGRQHELVKQENSRILLASSPLLRTARFFENSNSSLGVLGGSDYPREILLHVDTPGDLWWNLWRPLGDDSVGIARLGDHYNVDLAEHAAAINRENQQYKLYVNFNYIGDESYSKEVIESLLLDIRQKLPLGYRIDSDLASRNNISENTIAASVLVSMAVVFFVCAVILNSIRLSLAVIATIPISYIGVFVAGSLFGFSFSPGVYLSFVILTGVSVAGALHVVITYHQAGATRRNRGSVLSFVRAINQRFLFILFSRVTLLAGLASYLLEVDVDDFWFSVTLSVLGGSIFSLLATFVFLPLFCFSVDKK